MGGSDRTCRECGGALRDDARLCPRCGQRVIRWPGPPPRLPPLGPEQTVISQPTVPAGPAAPRPPAPPADFWWYADTEAGSDYVAETRSLPSGVAQPYQPPSRPTFQLAGRPPGPFAPPPGQPGQPEQPERRRGRRTRLIAAVAAAVVVAGGAAAAVSLHAFSHGILAGVSGPLHPSASRLTASGQATASSTASSPAVAPARAASAKGAVTEREAATSMAGLLARSGSDRTAIINAVNGVTSCGPSLASDPKVFQQAASSRQSLLGDLESMPGRGTLPIALINELTGAWQASIAADDDFARWADDEIAKGCVPNDTSDPGYQAAITPDNEATADKQAFVAQWNPLAARYGLTQYQPDQL